jgi:hypothetical protein
VFFISSPESKRNPSTASAPSSMAWRSRRSIASLRLSPASLVRKVISPPKKVWQPARVCPTTLRERTVIPQQGPITAAIAVVGGGSKVVRMGILCVVTPGMARRREHCAPAAWLGKKMEPGAQWSRPA